MAKKRKAEVEIELSPNELVAALKKQFSRAWNLERLLDDTEDEAREVLKRTDNKQTQDDAETVLFWLQSLRKKLETPDREAVTLAIKLGALAEKMGFRPLEPYAKQAWRAKEALRAAARDNAHSPEAISKALELYDSLRTAKPDRKKSAVEKEVQRETGIPPRTLRRHLKKRREAAAE